MMKMKKLSFGLWVASAVLALFVFTALPAGAAVDGVMTTNGNITLTAKSGFISIPDGNSVYMWGYALGNPGVFQYPGPTLIVNQFQTITITLYNQLPVPVSIVFPGQTNAVALSGSPGLLTREALPGGFAQYQFTASQPGTYMYYSGTMPEIQNEMGLFGVIVVRPFQSPTTQAYNSPSSAYDREYLYLLSEIDPLIHHEVQEGRLAQLDSTRAHPVYWFVNGRALPDTLLASFDSTLPSQPYGAAPQMRAGDRVLIRMAGGGRDLHPLHLHGTHHQVIARDARLLSTAGMTNGAVADLADFAFSSSVAPGQTTDGIFTWTGENSGWDLYGHAITDPRISGFGDGDEVFVQTTLAAPLGAGGTELTIASPAAGSWPATASFRAVIWPAATAFPGGSREVVRLKRRVGNGGVYNPDSNVFTIVHRGLEGTTAAGWAGASNIVFTDHGAPIPVTLPDQQFLTNGMFWSGSPYLGSSGPLPPGEGGFNPFNGYFFMWHSHSEKELTNFDIFPGGMATMATVHHPDPAVAPISDIPYITIVTP